MPPLAVVHEDDALIVVDKPAGIAVHPSPGHWSGTLMHAVLAHWARVGDAAQLGMVHRLDRDTSGLLVLGKRPDVSRHLSRQIERRQMSRAYLALVVGRPEPPAGVVDLPLAREPANRFRTVVTPDGQPARTRYRTVARFPGSSLLSLTLETGRTHQVRAHLAHLGHPLVGDALYRGPVGVGGAARQFLHAYRLDFDHPTRDERCAFSAPLPADLVAELVGAGT